MPLISFNTPWKHQNTSGFRMFLGGIERDQWHEMGKYAAEDFLERAFLSSISTLFIQKIFKHFPGGIKETNAMKYVNGKYFY